MDRLKGLDILLVEDFRDESSPLVSLLERAGYSVTRSSARSAEELSSTLALISWSAVICDTRLTVFDSIAAVQSFRDSGHDIPYVVVSDDVGEEAVVTALKSGASDYVSRGKLERLVPALESTIRAAQTRSPRRGNDEPLRDTEQRLRLALAASRTGVWQWDLATDSVYCSPECYAIVQREAPILSLDSFLQLIHPDDRDMVYNSARHALEDGSVFHLDFRILRPNGEVLWLSNLGQGKFDAQGEPLLVVGTLQDITERKKVEEKLVFANLDLERFTSYYQTILGRLHHVREEERAHLAREIHDELGQSLTSLKFGAHRVQRALEHNDLRGALAGVHECVSGIDEIIQSIRDIASDLRPPLLDHLGLAAALEWQSTRLQKQEGLRIEMALPSHEPDLTELQKITLFRIAQESLTNVMRHSGSKSARLSLDASDGIVLTIADQGSGIESRDNVGQSLGIMGMRERARLIGAVFTIEGRPGFGTTVQVKIPANISGVRHNEVRSKEKSATSR